MESQQVWFPRDNVINNSNKAELDKRIWLWRDPSSPFNVTNGIAKHENIYEEIF